MANVFACGNTDDFSGSRIVDFITVRFRIAHLARRLADWSSLPLALEASFSMANTALVFSDRRWPDHFVIVLTSCTISLPASRIKTAR